MARGEIYLELSVDFPDDPKVIAAGEKAELLYVRAALLAKRTLSDGFVADVQLPRFGLTGVQARARRLVDVGLWDRVDGGYQIRAFLRRNKSREQVLADRAKEADRKRQARGGVRPDIPPDSGPQSSRTPPGLRPPESESSTIHHPPPPTTGTAPGSSRRPTPVDDDRGPNLVDEACALLAQRDLDDRRQARPDERIADPGAWLLEATVRRRIEDGPRLTELAAIDPEAGPDQLVEALAAPAGPAPWLADDTTAGERVPHLEVVPWWDDDHQAAGGVA